MSLIVNSQQVARMTSQYMEKSSSNLARGLNRLSTGVKVNNTGDDAGSLAVSLKINSELKKSAATFQNIQNGRSFLSMQEGAYKQAANIIDRMAELRMLFDDPIKDESDKRNLDVEFRELKKELTQMKGAKLNGISLFSTEDQSKTPFHLPTRDGKTKIEITRTGFFDALTIATQGVGTTPDFTVTGTQGTMALQDLSVATSHSPSALSSSVATDGLYDTTQPKPAVKIYDALGTAVATVAATDVTLNTSGATKGTVSINLTTLPGGVTSAGAYTVKADDGNIYLDTADLTSAVGNQGSGYLGLPPGITITGPSGASATGDPATAPLTVDGATFAFTMKAAPDADKFGIAVTGTPTAAGEFTIKIDDGPMTSDNATISSSAATDGLYDTAQAKPAVKIYDAGGTAVATVATTDVTLNTAGATKGTLSIDLSTLPTGVAPAGTYTVKADNGNVYLDAADITSAAGSQGSGYLGLPPGVTITGPSLASVTGDPATAPLTVDGAIFTFTMKAAPDADKFGIAVTGTPTAAGEFTIQINDGPQGTASSTVPTVKGSSTGATGAVTTSADPALSQVRSSPALSADGSVLYAVDRLGKLVAINTATGADNWNGTGGLGRAIRNGTHIAVGPNGNFYFSSGNSVHAFRDNGTSVTELGSFQVQGITRNSPSVNTANEVFFMDRQSNIFALDGTDPASWGTFGNLNGVLWSADASASTSQSSPALSPLGDVVYVGSDDDRVHAYTAPAVGTTGTKLWDTGTLSNNQDADTKPVVDVAGNVYFVASSGGGSTVNATSSAGGGLWSVPLGQEAICNPTISSDGNTLYVGYDRGLKAYDTANGNELWSYPPAGNEIARLSQPAESNDGNTIYYGSGRDLHAVDAATGTQKWTFDTGGNINSASAIVDPTAGTIFIGSDSQKVFAIRDDGPGTPTQLWESGGGGFKLDAATVQLGKDYLPTETLIAGDITLSGAAATGVSVNSVTANGDGTFDVGLTGTPTSAGTITASIKASANGAPHLKDLADVGSGYLSTMTTAELAALTVTIAGTNPGDEGTLVGTVEGDPLNGGGLDPGTGALKLVKFTGTPTVEGNFTVTIQNGPPAGTATDVGVTAMQGAMAAQTINVTKAGTATDVGVTALQGTMTAQNLTVGLTATPGAFTSSTATDSPYTTKPAANIYDSAGAIQIATVNPSNVTLNGNGTVSVDLSSLPGGLTAGAYKVKAEDEAIVSAPASINVGSGYDLAEPAPNIAFISGPVGTLSVANASINPSGSVAIDFAGTPGGTGPITVSVDDGTMSTSGEGLMNDDLHLWDFSASDFTRYIEVLSNARAVNGAETASFSFSENLLVRNMQHLEMANGRMIDADMASEMTQLAKNQIKMSSATVMLAKHTKLGTLVDLTLMNLS
jgi:flagellin-like hook-associated protein FlgL/outer membrane protein assembly factor BamB